jgi:hypothetical protein
MVVAQPDSSQLVIQYKVEHMVDTGTKILINYPLLLFTGNKTSYCISKNIYDFDSLSKANPIKVQKTGETYFVEAPP